MRTTGSFQKAPPPPSKKKVPRPTPEFVEVDPSVHGRIEDRGPGKNVLIRNPYVREDTGTHETLKILDDSVIDSGEEAGIAAAAVSALMTCPVASADSWWYRKCRSASDPVIRMKPATSSALVTISRVRRCSE